MHKYRLVAKKGEGTFSEVLKAQCIKNGKYVAIKCMKNHFESLDQVNNLREIQALRRLSPHANIIKLQEVLYDQPTGRLALVFELMDMNIYELIRGRRHYVAEDRVKNYMYQLMKAMDHMHRNGIFHRDLKPENILIMDDRLKLADFGSCRGIYSKQPYTEYISTRWYRAPECLLTDGYYNYKMDMWGVGCVFFEIVSLFPLFPGTNELDQIQKIHNILGTHPPELLAKMKKRSQHMDFNFPPKEGTGIAKLIPHVAPDCVELIVKLLSYNPDDRLSARQALRHPYFRELREAEKRAKALMTPEVPSLLPGQTSQSGHLQLAHSTQEDGTLLKSARQQASPPVSEDGTTVTTTATAPALPAVLHPSSPPEGSRAIDQSQSLPSISKAGGLQPAHAPHHSHSHSTHLHSHPQLAAQGVPMHAHAHGHHAAAHHLVQESSYQMSHGGQEDDVGSSYRLHAEGSLETVSATQGDGGLPPIGNASQNKGLAAAGAAHRRAVPNYGYQGHEGSLASYPGKAKPSTLANLTKRQAMGAVSHPKGYPSIAGKAGMTMPAGFMAQVSVAGHKVAGSDMSAAATQPSYKFKSSSIKQGVGKYMGAYRHLQQ